MYRGNPGAATPFNPVTDTEPVQAPGQSIPLVIFAVKVNGPGSIKFSTTPLLILLLFRSHFSTLCPLKN